MARGAVLERVVAGGWVLAFGVGRWLWALVWAPVGGEGVQHRRWRRAREKRRAGREGRLAKNEEEPRARWGKVGSLGGWDGRDRLGLWESDGVV